MAFQSIDDILVDNQDVDKADLREYLKNREVINVRDFGAAGDGVTDDSAAITAADAAAANAGVSLEFPHGTYCAYDVSPTAPWVGDTGNPKAVVIKNNNPSGNRYQFVYVNGGSWSCAGMTFDGGASDDPTTWDSTTYNDFDGSNGLVLSQVSNFSLFEVHAQNCGMAGFRFERCSDGRVINCTTNRTRNEFGDGFYFTSCHDIIVASSLAADHQRIGFVTEGNSTYGPSSNIVFLGCRAENGNHQGKDYGGTEYNVGFWSENSTDIAFIGCRIKDQTHGAIVFSPGVGDGVRTDATVTITDCFGIGTGVYGINLGSTGSSSLKPVCKVSGAQMIGMPICFQVQSGVAGVYNFTDCYGKSKGLDQNNNANNTAVFTHNSGAAGDVINIKNCVGDWIDTSALSATSTAYKGDIIKSSSSVAATINIDNYRNLSGTALIKNRTAQSTVLNIRNTNCDIGVQPGAASGSVVNISGGEVAGTIYAEQVHIDAKVKEGAQFYAVTPYLTGNAVIHGDASLRHDNSVDSKEVVCVLNVDMRKDFVTDGYGLRLQYEGTVKPTAIISGVIFNTGTASATETAIWSVRSGTQLIANGLITDASLDYTIGIGSPVTSRANFAAGEQRVTVH
jgi:hypothetical protein